MDNITHLVAADTEDTCPICGENVVISAGQDGTGSELACGCTAYLVA